MRSRMRGTPAQSGGSFRSVRDEDQLVAWSVGRFAYVVEEVAGGGERGSDLFAGEEAQHGVRGQTGAVGVEDEGPAERYERWAEVGDLHPCLYAADAGDDLVLVCLVGGPFQPGPCCRITCLEDQAS